MNPLAKSLLGIGLVGGGTGLSVSGYYLFKSAEPKTLLEKFQSKNLDVFYGSEATENDWNAKLNDYKGESESDRFSDLAKEGVDFTKLKDKCKAYLEKSPEEIGKTAGLEDRVKKWCTKDKPQA